MPVPFPKTPNNRKDGPTMSTAEVIEKLATYSPETPVLIYSGDYDEYFPFRESAIREETKRNKVVFVVLG